MNEITLKRNRSNEHGKKILSVSREELFHNYISMIRVIIIDICIPQ